MDNVLEDVYIEGRICEAYPGTFARGIQLNNLRFGKTVPTVASQVENGHLGYAIIANLMIQYCKTGDVNNLTRENSEYLDVLVDCLPILDAAMYDDDGRAREKRPFRRHAGKRGDELAHGRELGRKYGQPCGHDDEGNQRARPRPQPRGHDFRHGVGPGSAYLFREKKGEQRKAARAGTEPPEGGRAYLPCQPGHAHGGGTAYAGGDEGKARMPCAGGTAVHEEGGLAPGAPGVEHAEAKEQKGVKAEDQHGCFSTTGTP